MAKGEKNGSKGGGSKVAKVGHRRTRHRHKRHTSGDCEWHSRSRASQNAGIALVGAPVRHPVRVRWGNFGARAEETARE